MSDQNLQSGPKIKNQVAFLDTGYLIFNRIKCKEHLGRLWIVTSMAPLF